MKRSKNRIKKLNPLCVQRAYLLADQRQRLGTRAHQEEFDHVYTSCVKLRKRTRRALRRLGI